MPLILGILSKFLLKANEVISEKLGQWITESISIEELITLVNNLVDGYLTIHHSVVSK